MCLERRKNEYLHHLLSTLRSSEPDTRDGASESNAADLPHLERTYRKALSDYQAAQERLEQQTAAASKTATELRERLDEKEAEAERLEQELNTFRLEVAKQSSFANGRPLDVERVLEESDNQDLSEHLERERLKYITLKVEVSQLEQKQRKANNLPGGVSDAEFSALEASLQATEKKIQGYEADLRRMNENGAKLLRTEEFLTKAIKDYSEKNASKAEELSELNNDIDDKRHELERLNKKIAAAKKEIGYDASDLDAFLQTRAVNHDFASSKKERETLRAKLNGLVLQLEPSSV